MFFFRFICKKEKDKMEQSAAGILPTKFTLKQQKEVSLKNCPS